VEASRLVVFGAAGRTGRLVVEEAGRRGLEVTAALRDPKRVSFGEAVRMVDCDARERDDVARALEGADAAISVMAIPSGTGPTTELSEATRTIVAAMTSLGPKRLVVTVNTAVFHDRPVKPPYDVVAEEHRRDVAILRESALEWTALAATFLTDDEPTGSYVAELDAKAPGGGIPRGDLAVAALDAFDHDDWIGHVVGLAGSV
jgi:putative NADH-flavin reductase